MTTKAVAYLRVSGASQLDGNGWERQLEAIQSYARTHDIELVGVYKEEAISGKTEAIHRPAFTAMLADLLSNGCRTIIVERLDRLAREYRIQEELVLYLIRHGLTLISADAEEDITAAMNADPMKKAVIQILGILAELDKNMIVAKLKKARASKRAKGGFAGGTLPYGYCPDKATEEQIVRANQERVIAQRIRLARQQGYGYTAIKQGLEAEGLKPRNGREWQVSTIKQIAGKD